MVNNLTKFTMEKSVVVQSPKDEILVGVLVDVNKTTWREIIDPEKLDRFDEPDQPIIKVKYEVEYKGNHLKGEENYKYYEKPMANSSLGKFLLKYDKLAVGTQIKVIFDGKGFSSIKLD